MRPLLPARIVGLDYDLFISRALTGSHALAMLKYALDQRLAGNRAPFVFGAHGDVYTDSETSRATLPQDRRDVIEQFIEYALSKPEVRFVTGRDLISWMRRPVPLRSSSSP
jgi:hypothetical protein